VVQPHCGILLSNKKGAKSWCRQQAGWASREVCWMRKANPKASLLYHSISVTFFFFLVGLGFELRVSPLQSRHSAAWTTPPVHFALLIFGDGGLMNYLPGLASNCDTPNLSLPSS
jgi:hypothetical protein